MEQEREDRRKAGGERGGKEKRLNEGKANKRGGSRGRFRTPL